jgi:hypothetical protein
MGAVAILRQLWRRRLLVSVGVAFALIVGTVMVYRVNLGLPPTFESRQYDVGVASAELLVDSPSSQVVDLSGGRVATDVNALSGRARLLANLMVTSPLKDQIARRAGINPRTFTASVPTLNGPAPPPSPLAPGKTSPWANSLTVSFNEELPIITAVSQAATPDSAARISTAAVAQLGTYLKSVAAIQRVPYANQLVISPLGRARSGLVQHGPSRIFALAAVILLVAVWCAGIVLLSRLARDWRQAAADEQLAEHDEKPAGSPPAGTGEGRPVVDVSSPSPVIARERVDVAQARELPDRLERPEHPWAHGAV